MARSHHSPARLTIALALLTTPLMLCAGMSVDDLRERGHVRGAFVNEVPFGFIGPRGEVTGESPEIARHIFSELGIDHFDGLLTEWPSLLPGLHAGRWDVITAGMYITPERCEQAVFTDPTYRVEGALLVEAGNPLRLHGFDDIRDSEHAILGVMAGAVERDVAREFGIPDARVEEVPTQQELLVALRTGRIDAVALSDISIEQMASEGGDDVERAMPFDSPDSAIGYGGFAFRPEDRALAAAFNERLQEFIGTEEHLELMTEFDFSKDNLPGDVTAAQLCAGDIP